MKYYYNTCETLIKQKHNKNANIFLTVSNMFHRLLTNHLILQRAAQMKRLEIIPTRKQNKFVSHFTS